MAPPVVLFFCLSGTCDQRVQRRALVGVQGAKNLEGPKNLHPTVPKTGFEVDQKYLNGYAFLHVHCSTKSQENSKRSGLLNSRVSYQKKCVCFIFLAEQYFKNF